MHVFYAQGGGLGHLTRVDNLINRLSIPAEDILIITPSLFTKYFKGYTFIQLSWQDEATSWTKTIKAVLEKHSDMYFYIDTFPFGLKGELKDVYKTFPNIKYVYIARILKWSFYLDKIKEVIPIRFLETIILETLYAEHFVWINKHSGLITYFNLVQKPVKQVPFMSTPYVLVVHSGGKQDVLKLCQQAIKDFESITDITIVVFTQVDIELNHPSVVVKPNVFPVSHYFKHAQKIYTAAGFNSMYELEMYKEKHVVIPLEKLFDDQFFRYKNFKK